PSCGKITASRRGLEESDRRGRGGVAAHGGVEERWEVGGPGELDERAQGVGFVRIRRDTWDTPRVGAKDGFGEGRVGLEAQQGTEVRVGSASVRELPVEDAGHLTGRGVDEKVARVEVTVDQADPRFPAAVEDV